MYFLTARSDDSGTMLAVNRCGYRIDALSPLCPCLCFVIWRVCLSIFLCFLCMLFDEVLWEKICCHLGGADGESAHLALSLWTFGRQLSSPPRCCQEGQRHYNRAIPTPLPRAPSSTSESFECERVGRKLSLFQKPKDMIVDKKVTNPYHNLDEGTVQTTLHC